MWEKLLVLKYNNKDVKERHLPPTSTYDVKMNTSVIFESSTSCSPTQGILLNLTLKGFGSKSGGNNIVGGIREHSPWGESITVWLVPSFTSLDSTASLHTNNHILSVLVNSNLVKMEISRKAFQLYCKITHPDWLK